MARVRISKTPKALSGLEMKMRPGLYGTNGNRQFTLPNQVNSQRFSQQPIDVRDTLQPVAREGANLEAEKGETAVVPINGMPAHFKIGGKRHHSGGTPLNLPDNSFIFSDTAKMKIKDPIVLAQFGMVPKKSGYTPAEIAKKYDINTFRKILADPNSEDLERKTAEAMIAKYNMKLAKLALIQESMKGFPQGIPQVAMPYLIANDIDPQEFLETQGQEEQPDADTGEARYGGNMISQFPTKKYGGLPKAQDGLFDFNNDPNNSKFSKKVSKPITEYDPSQYVGMGFDNDPEQEKAFATDVNTKNAYLIYKDALASGKPDDLKRAIGDLSSDAFDVPGFAWYLGSDQNRISDLKRILKQELNKKTGENSFDIYNIAAGNPMNITSKYAENEKKRYEKDKELKGILTDLYGKVDYLKNIEDDPLQSQTYNLSLEKMDDMLHKVTYTDPIKPTGQNGELPRFPSIEDEDRRWIREEHEKINKILKAKTEQTIKEQKAERSKPYVKIITESNKTYEELITPPFSWKGSKEAWKAAADKSIREGKTIPKGSVAPAKYKESATSMSSEKPATNYSDTTVLLKDIPNIKQKDLDRLRAEKKAGRNISYKELGGALPKADLGDEVDPLDAEANKRKNKGKSNQPVNTLDPYSGYTEAELAELLEDPTILRKTKVSGSQDPSAKDIFGKDVSVQDWMKRNPEYSKKFKEKYGRDFTEKDSEIFQKDYNKHIEDLAYNRAIEAGYDDAKAKSLSKRFSQTQGFKSGTRIKGDPSFIDSKFGEYTSSRFEPIFKSTKKKETVVTAPPADPPKKEKEKPGEEVVVDVDPIKPYVLPKKAPWFIQDAIPFAGELYNQATVNRYRPARFYPETRVPGAVYKSPEREAAKIGEAAQQAMAARATFGNTQGQAAANSAAQGIAGSQIADVFANTQNYNIGIANQLANTRADIMNQAGINRAGITKKFYDEGNIESQQYDNTMRDIRGKRNLLLANGITNAANAYNLNTLNPNFKTNPWQGGRIDYVSDNAKFKPSKDYEKKNVWSDYQDALDKTGDPNAAIKLLQIMYGKGVSSKNDDDIAGYPS